ncbi:MAG: YihY/virulence factor BrkB family protein [Candidatus Latescibacterota bacterium]|nr:MAG: YihY/virulence factor BrkB family protein [Candidatus Latescibacterota bacterium]
MKRLFRNKRTITPRDVSDSATRAVSTTKLTIVGLLRAIRGAWNGFFERRVPMMAAGLAFYFLLGLIPFLFLVAATTGYFLNTSPGILKQIDETLLTILPPGIGEMLLTQVQSAASNWQALGAAALFSLILVAMGLFDGLDEGINAVMGSKKKVGFLTGRIISFAYIVGAILFFSIAAVAGYALKLLEAVPFFQKHPAVFEVFGRYFSVWVFAVFLLALYMTLPVKTPKLFHAIVVSLAVTGAWFVLQKLGTFITAGISRRQAIYGALAGAAVFLTWMYLLAMLILLGARILDFWRGSAKGSPIDADEYM